MDDEELEKIKENLEKAEFNNDEEDLKEIGDGFRRVDHVSFREEKKEEEVEEDADNEEEEEELEEEEQYKPKEGVEKKKIESSKDEDSFEEKEGINKTTIILCAIIVVLLIIICILFIPKLFGGSSKSKGGDDSYDDEGKITNPTIDISKGKSSFINDNYLYVNYEDAAYITKLDGTVVYQDDDKACSMMSDSYFMCERSDGSSKVKYVIKKLNDSGTSENIIEEENFDSDDRIVCSGSKLVGYYSEGNNGTHMAILNNGSTKEIDLNNLYLLKIGDSMTRKIYGARFVIVSDNRNNNATDGRKHSYGVYDIINNKSLIKPKYESMVYLFDDLFIAVKDGKSGIVDTNDNVKVDFKYDAIDYANGLYFAGNGETVRVLDKTFKTIGDPIKVKSLTNYRYYASKNNFDAKSCGDMVILSKNEANKYSVVDKLGKSTDYDFGQYEVIGNRVVTLKDKSLVLYDTNFNKIQEFTVPNNINIDLDTAVIYIETNLVFNGCYVFDINSGKYLYQMNNLARSYQGYYVDLHFQNGIGKADVSLDDKPVGSIDNIDISEFLKAENNGIRVTNENFIFHVADKTLVVKR